MIGLRGLLVALALALPGPALAQAYQCAPPANIGPLRPITPDGPVRRVPVSGYTLAVSWTPEYCKGARDGSSMQCSGANGRFGFILHGLWPESRQGPPPQWCATTPQPAPDLIRRNLCMTPAPALLQHEWAKHGTCMRANGQPISPNAYFNRSRAMYSKLRFPDMTELAQRGTMTAGAFASAFAAANKGLRADMMRVTATRDGWLDEVWLCLDRRFRNARCPTHQGGLKPADSLRIRPQ